MLKSDFGETGEREIADTLPPPFAAAVTDEERTAYYRTHPHTYEIAWNCGFLIFGEAPLFPRPLSVSTQIVQGPQYRCDCRLRAGDTIRYFCYTLSGTGGITDASGSHLVKEGHGFLAEVDNPLTSYYYPPEAMGPWRFLAFAFHGLQAHVMVRALLKQYGPVYQLPRESRIIQRLLAYEPPHSSPGQTHLTQMQLPEAVELVTDLLTTLVMSRMNADKPGQSQDLVHRAVAMITADATLNLRINDVALQLGVSREHLSRLCQSRLGKSLRTLMLEQRIYRAGRLLKETDMPIKTIAEMLGYTSYSNFLHAFKDVTNMTPHDFRMRGTLNNTLPSHLSIRRS
jgi:AraC-like DNA-binding protein